MKNNGFNPEDNAEEVNEADESEEKSSESHFESTYKLKANEQYESEGYQYETDKYGRIQRCEGTLRLEEGTRHNNHQLKAGGEYRLKNDEGGHLIGTEFGGSGKIDNIVAMDYDLNHHDYYELEQSWKNELKKDNQVDVSIECKYSGKSERPDYIIVKTKITEPDGTERFQFDKFENKKG
jgi:hypothetical protein